MLTPDWIVHQPDKYGKHVCKFKKIDGHKIINVFDLEDFSDIHSIRFE